MNNPIMALAQMAMNRISSDLISVNCCDFDRLTVTNTGAIPVVISTNPLLYVKRVS